MPGGLSQLSIPHGIPITGQNVHNWYIFQFSHNVGHQYKGWVTVGVSLYWKKSALKMQSTLNSSNNLWNDRRRSQLQEKVTIATKVKCGQRHEEEKRSFHCPTGQLG